MVLILVLSLMVLIFVFIGFVLFSLLGSMDLARPWCSPTRAPPTLKSSLTSASC